MWKNLADAQMAMKRDGWKQVFDGNYYAWQKNAYPNTIYAEMAWDNEAQQYVSLERPEWTKQEVK